MSVTRPLLEPDAMTTSKASALEAQRKTFHFAPGGPIQMLSGMRIAARFPIQFG
jgi:hypothetical protein